MSKRMIDSELIEGLSTNIKFDGKGNVKVGKNLEVKGITKLNKGLAFVHTYAVSSTQNINIMFETYLNGLGYTGFVGTLSDGQSEFICMGTYLEVGAPYVVVSLMFIDNNDSDKVKYAKGNADGNSLTLSNFTLS